jgi:hypothetical protein
MIHRQHNTLLQVSTATFSDCERYRYRLTRTWDDSKPAVCYLMMNPSTATEVDNDNTIERCQRRAVALGFGGIVIVNVFPYRLTDSRQLKFVDDLIGDMDEADDAIAYGVRDTAMTICGWGEHNELILPRVQHVLTMLTELGLAGKLHAIAVNGDGSPRHPLYVGYAKQPQPWKN